MIEPFSPEEFVEGACHQIPTLTLDSFVGEQPRWCQGCGDYSILTSLEKVLANNQIPPNEVVCVSGIGCSSRFPYYLKTFGFHGIHGRALPISTGVALANPKLKVFTVMGDGDCFSIGMGHWMHAFRYNPNLTVMVFDNEIYGLTKKQTSPTTPLGTATRTTPSGPYIEPLNPLKMMMGATGLSFLAQSATWLPGHLQATLQKAYEHQGLSFVRILQRCPIFSPQAYGEGGQVSEIFTFLEDEKGIEVDPALAHRASHKAHDPFDYKAAQLIAEDRSQEPLGLIYHEPERISYEALRHAKLAKLTDQERTAKLEKLLDEFQMGEDR